MHQREYTMLGVSAAIQAFYSEDFKSFIGTRLKEIVALIKNGDYYHAQILGDRQRSTKTFVRKVNQEGLPYAQTYRQLSRWVSEYNRLIRKPPRSYTVEMILDVYRYYRNLMPAAYAVMGAADYIHILDTRKQKPFLEWVKKTRRRLETVYKEGEEEFVPRYVRFLSRELPGYAPQELRNLLCTETEDWILRGVDIPKPEELRSRTKLFYVRHFHPTRIEYASGRKARTIIDQAGFFKKQDVSRITALKGVTAHPGRAIGRVRLLRKRSDMQAFKSGEIIVSTMTQPSYLPAMKQAAAFVTNEGGILCHAAIVSRELKKPCIIGTGIATDVFRNGERVEVDAAKGVVKKL